MQFTYRLIIIDPQTLEESDQTYSSRSKLIEGAREWRNIGYLVRFDIREIIPDFQ